MRELIIIRVNHGPGVYIICQMSLNRTWFSGSESVLVFHMFSSPAPNAQKVSL